VLSLVCSVYSLQIYSQDKVVYYYPDSTISSIGTLLNGRPDGYWKNFYPDGHLKSEGNWYKGLLDSTWNFYFHSGHIKLIIQYNKGVKNGYTYTYKLNNDSLHFLHKKELFIDGQLEGKSFTYNSTGRVVKVSGYKNNSKVGNEITFSENGKPISLYTFDNNRLIDVTNVNRISNGTKNGTWIQIDDNYQIVTNKIYSNDSIVTDKFNQKQVDIKYTIEGLAEQSRDSAFQGQFINGIPVGRHLQYDSLLEPISFIFYDSLGNKTEEGFIKKYKLHGLCKGYYSDGSLKYYGKYSNNRMHGIWKYYYSTGAIEQKGIYKNGKLDGKWLWFYKNSDTLRIETYRFNNRDGLYLSYDPYGQIVKKGYYYNDLKQDKWIENTGEFVLTGSYFDGLKNEEWKGKYHNGETAFVGKYLRGKPDGKHVYYYLNGNKRKIEYYNLGKKVGHWQYFTPNGQLFKVKSYNKGETIYFKE
jgi:antitoxin component YwqK of YwqJK toxin-antitoxin module